MKSKVLKNVEKRTFYNGSISLTSNTNPEIKEWEVGKEYEITVKVRQSSTREVDKWEKEAYGLKKGDQVSMFEIIKVVNTGKPKAKKEVYITKN